MLLLVCAVPVAGYGGQYIMIFRDLGLVIVTTSSTAASDELRDYRRQLFELVERLILAPVAALPPGLRAAPSSPRRGQVMNRERTQTRPRGVG
jgi:hypothetical protein